MALNQDIISCSWGLDLSVMSVEDRADCVCFVRTLILRAINQGTKVVFSCGNEGDVDFPGNMPRVISVGGAYVDQSNNWEASSYASSGTNNTFPNRIVPDVCGIVGQASEKGKLIVFSLPVAAELRL